MQISPISFTNKPNKNKNFIQSRQNTYNGNANNDIFFEDYEKGSAYTAEINRAILAQNAEMRKVALIAKEIEDIASFKPEFYKSLETYTHTVKYLMQNWQKIIKDNEVEPIGSQIIVNDDNGITYGCSALNKVYPLHISISDPKRDGEVFASPSLLEAKVDYSILDVDDKHKDTFAEYAIDVSKNALELICTNSENWPYGSLGYEYKFEYLSNKLIRGTRRMADKEISFTFDKNGKVNTIQIEPLRHSSNSDSGSFYEADKNSKFGFVKRVDDNLN